MNYGVQTRYHYDGKRDYKCVSALSATAVKREIYEAYVGSEEYDRFRHVNTFGGNPAACALALKNMEIYGK